MKYGSVTVLLCCLVVLLATEKSEAFTNNNIDEAVGLKFLVLGDWGGLPIPPYTTPIETSVASMMAKTAQDIGAEFVVALGDNFYFTGVDDEKDARFLETFENVYKAESLQVPWYVIAGNHDHYGNVSAQIAYTTESKRWKFPNFYHSHVFKIPGTTKSLHLILIDTVQLCGHSGSDHNPTPLKGPKSPSESDLQLQWIERTLAKSTADYIIVGGHYPVWSIGHHGPTEQMVDQLKPLFDKYQVTSYICGHDHNLQSIQEDNLTTAYHVVGCANFVDPRKTHESSVPEGSSKFFWAELYGGFASVEVTGDDMVFTFLSNSGKELYQVKSAPRKLQYNMH
eukprot:gene7543-8380_t